MSATVSDDTEVHLALTAVFQGRGDARWHGLQDQTQVAKVVRVLTQYLAELSGERVKSDDMVDRWPAAALAGDSRARQCVV